jgi:hypothetical protein
VRYLLTAFCKLQELPIIFCCCANRNCVVGFVKSVPSVSMQIRLICSWFQTFAVVWMLYAFFCVIPRRLNYSILRLCYNTLMRVLQGSHSEHYRNDALIDTDVSEFVLWRIFCIIEWTNRNQTLKHTAVTKLLQEQFIWWQNGDGIICSVYKLNDTKPVERYSFLILIYLTLT